MKPMYQFSAALWALPPGAEPGQPVMLRGVPCRPLQIPPGQEGTPFGVSFETVCQRLEAWERMLIEPDGSLVWTCADRSWQLDGNLYDRADRLLYVDLSGGVPPVEFDALLAACDWPATPVMFQLRDAGVYVSEADFRRWAEC